MDKAAVHAVNTKVPAATTTAQKKVWMDAYISACEKYKIVNKTTAKSSKPQQQKAKLVKSNSAANQQPGCSPGATTKTCSVTPCTADTITI